jgi:hypothetical protein
MQHELNHTVQALLGARGLDEVSRDNLSDLVREYPYSALLHLLYSKKLQQVKDPRYAESVARTALYFSNPHWLHHLLRPKTSRDAVQEMELAFEEHTQEAAPEMMTHVPIASDSAFSATEAPDIESPPTPQEEAGVEVMDQSEETRKEAIEQVIETGLEHEGEPEPEVSEPIDSEPFAVGQMEVTEPKPTPEPEVTVSPELSHPLLEQSQAAWEEPGIRTLITVPELPGFGLPSPETVETGETAGAAVPAAEIPVVTRMPASGPLLPVDSGLVPLEPYYTIDYFASQGIQLSEDEKQDPLGRKLKKFTEWLRTMKKIHPEKSGPVAADSHSEETIREGAEHSNESADVVTEAMAEVYVMQGQPDKALEIYRKLSLLDPSRSATFAAKIAELNNPDA